LNMLFIRWCGSWTWKSIVATCLCLSLFLHHLYYLVVIQFDYGYNMKINLVVGLVNAIGWWLWCLSHYAKQGYAWKCATFVVLVVLTTALDVIEFSPFFWILDAHSLWHLSTAPLPILWYSFIIDDCNYCLKSEREKERKKVWLITFVLWSLIFSSFLVVCSSLLLSWLIFKSLFIENVILCIYSDRLHKPISFIVLKMFL